MVDKIQVAVFGCPGATVGLADRLNAFQSRYRFASQASPGADTGYSSRGANLHLLPEEPVFFTASRERGVRLSTRDCNPISRYLGVLAEDYLMMGALLGLAQWRILQVNPLLNPEDLLHEPTNSCLYSPCPTVQDSALVLENAAICPGCREFYWCLGAETELCLIQDLAEQFGRAFA